MKKLIFAKPGALLFILYFTVFHGSPAAYSIAPAAPPSREIYEIKIYHLKNKSQEVRVDKFLQQAYIPAVHRTGVKNVGVFKPVGNDTVADRRIYVFIPFSSLNQFASLPDQLAKDKDYNTAGADYLDAVYNDPPYIRLEVIQLEAFPDAPKMQLPQLKAPKAERIYELRSYESPTERYHISKVKMFNEGGEIKLFKSLGFNGVFYSRVLAGCRMPNLMYMTTFENKAVRDEHWKAFFADPVWLKLSAMAEYKNNVSRNDTQFLVPVDYSDF